MLNAELSNFFLTHRLCYQSFLCQCVSKSEGLYLLSCLPLFLYNVSECVCVKRRVGSCWICFWEHIVPSNSQNASTFIPFLASITSWLRFCTYHLFMSLPIWLRRLCRFNLLYVCIHYTYLVSFTAAQILVISI